jgi:DNA-binding NarL/FixJ family response regulator
MRPIRLFIIEDQEAILDLQVKLLSRFPDIEIVAKAKSGESAIADLLGMAVKPDVILCDLGLPKMTGIDVIRFLKAKNYPSEILVFTVFEDENNVLDALRAGASGYLLKGAEADKIHDAIVDVAAGGTVIQPSLARRLLKYFSPQKAEDREKLPKLSVREIECLQMIAKGLSNNEVAGVLELSKSTIRTHIEHIYQKLDVTNRVEAVTEAIRHGIIEL